jgi:serine phosphatase RsbU (regulator of sigma subunit)
MSLLPQRTKGWLNLALYLGWALGGLLFVHSIINYRFVAGRLLQEAAERESGRKFGDVLRTMRASETSSLQDVVDKVRSESPQQIAWIRVTSFDGRVLAVTGNPGGEPLPSAPAVDRRANLHQPVVRLAGSGRRRVLIAASRLRLPRPPAAEIPHAHPGRPGGAGIIEIAILMRGVSVSFARLETNLILGCLAALALLASNAWIAVLLRRHLRAREVDRQLELARDVQHHLLPVPGGGLVPGDGLEFAALFVPAAEVGGDFYDVFEAGDGRLALVIGDVSGKGVSAALLVGVIHGAVRSSAWAQSLSAHEAATRRLNRLLTEKSDSARFATLFWASVQPGGSVLRYINAGHLPPLLIRARGGRIERLHDGGGPVLGLLPHASYAAHEVTIGPGDLLVMYSDGIAEAMTADGEEFGVERLAAVVRDNATQSPGEIRDAVRLAVARFLGPMKPHDDQTLVIARLIPVADREPVTDTQAAVPGQASSSPAGR